MTKPGTDTTAGEHRAFTAEAMRAPGGSDRLKRLPRLVVTAMRLVWAAAPRPLVMTVALQLVSGVALAAQLVMGRYLLSELIEIQGTGEDLGRLTPAFAVLVLAMVASAAVTALTQQYQRLLIEHVGRHTFDEIIDVSARVEYPAFEDPVFHDQLERARLAGMYRPIEMVTSVVAIVSGVLTSAGVGLTLLLLEPILVPIVVLAGIPILIATLINARQSYTFDYLLTPQSRERLYLMEILTDRSPAKEVRIFGAARLLKRRYDALTDERFVELHKYLRKRLRVALAGALGAALGTSLALLSLAWLLGTGRTSVATAVTAGLAMTLLSMRVRMVFAASGKLVESGMFLDDFLTFLRIGNARIPADAEDLGRGAEKPADSFSGLRVEELTFTYPTTGKTVLSDVSLEVAPGEIVALVGENGSGKTTLIKLVCQLYQPGSGRVLWNGRDAREVGAATVQRDMTVLFQDYVHYMLSVSDNIALGRTSADTTPENIREAAVRAGADDFIADLRDGYDTRLGLEFHGGAELSVGQWQRLALARAFFRGGPFLIMDEPTASLDPRAEFELFSQMRELAEGRSVLLVSHRFSSVRNADRIYVLRDGRVVESGTHDVLVALDGYYAELYGLQSQTFARRDEAVSASPAP